VGSIGEGRAGALNLKSFIFVKGDSYPGARAEGGGSPLSSLYCSGGQGPMLVSFVFFGGHMAGLHIPSG